MYYYYDVKWWPKDRQSDVRHDYFCERETGEAMWGKVVGELSYVHISKNPEDSVRGFLLALPLDGLNISKESYIPPF